MNRRTLPQGMHDKLFKRARATYEIEKTISDFLIEKGFTRIETPMLEHFEVFGDAIQTDHYHLFDKKGDLLTLRPDITSQIGRVIASTKVELPVKFSYSGKVFRDNEEMRGLENEHTQAGVEIIGYKASEALKEAISSAKHALDQSGVDQYHFEFSHAAILQTVFKKLHLSDEAEKSLKEAITNKNITALTEFTKNYPSSFTPFLVELPFLFGPMETVLKRAKELVEDDDILLAIDEMEDELRMNQFLPSQISIDLGQLPPRPYYTGLMFQVFDHNVPDAFVSGGQYDKLFERFGSSELTAVGWAIDIESVYKAIHHKFTYKGGIQHD